MELIVRGRSVPISSGLREHCTDRVERALLPFRQHVQSAELVLVDFNGPKGGPAQACRISIGLADGTRLTVQSLDCDFYVASGLAAARVGHLLQRELGRTRARGRRARPLAKAS